MAVGPWGEVLAVREEDGEGMVLAELDAARTRGVLARNCRRWRTASGMSAGAAPYRAKHDQARSGP